LRERAAQVIPGGMYGHQSTGRLPKGYPQFFSRAEGCRLWDCDGNELIDYMCAYGPNLLGYHHRQVEEAAARQQAFGDALTGPSEVMVDYAERLVATVGHADWAMFTKNGADSTSSCIQIARAYTGRNKILVAEGSYHGANFWSTPRPSGVPEDDRRHLIRYRYNDIASLDAAVAEAGDDFAGIFATAYRHDAFVANEAVDPAFARHCRALADRHDAVLMVDDVRAGFRMARDCSWSTVGVEPDLSSWGKVLANGHPISAHLGNERMREAAAGIFITGSYWFAAVPMAAGLAVLDVMEETDVVGHVTEMGVMLRSGLAEQAERHGFDLIQSGPPQMPQILFADDPERALGDAWCLECLERGVYFHPWHNMFLSLAHTEDDIARTLEATDAAFRALQSRRSPTQG
jgi:glutamate-1-semialdehyde 2,1-aminomutase